MSRVQGDGRPMAAPAAREAPGFVPRAAHAVLDVRDLPTVVYGSRGLMWWGAIGFMIVEGVSFAVSLVAYYYLRRNFADWPPVPTPLPPLWLGTLSLAVLLLNIWPTWMFERAGKRRDRRATMRWLWVSCAVMTAGCGLRLLEMRLVGTRWDEHAYGSCVWAILFLHLTLVATDALDTAGLASIFSAGRDEEKHLVDATDNAFYTWFSIVAWIPGFVTIYLVPRWW